MFIDERVWYDRAPPISKCVTELRACTLFLLHNNISYYYYYYYCGPFKRLRNKIAYAAQTTNKI